MGLIDADALLLELELLQDEADAKYHETDFDSFYGGICSMIQEAIKVAEKQPTAFDVDKVVKQLKERSKEFNSGLRLHGKPEDILTDEAIEIVKAGGMDGN